MKEIVTVTYYMEKGGCDLFNDVDTIMSDFESAKTYARQLWNEMEKENHPEYLLVEVQGWYTYPETDGTETWYKDRNKYFSID